MTTTENTSSPDTQAFSVRFDHTINERMREAGFALRISKANLLRRAITEFLDRQDAAAQQSHAGETCMHCGRVPELSAVVSEPGEPRTIACMPLCKPFRDHTGYPVCLGDTVTVSILAPDQYVHVEGRVIKLKHDETGRALATVLNMNDAAPGQDESRAYVPTEYLHVSR